MVQQPTQTRMRAEDYFRLPEYEQHDLIQLIDGEVVIGMPPIPKHQDIVGEIFFMLKTIVKKSGGRVFLSPIEVYFDTHDVYEPDVLYLKPDTACEVGEKRLLGAPDLVVEVLSPSTAKYDRQQKYGAYEQHGVSEYWIVDPAHGTVEVWALAEESYQKQGVYAGEDTFESEVLGEAVSVKAFFGS